MKKSLLARLRRRISSRSSDVVALSRSDERGSGVEALEPRLLLSAATLGELPSLNTSIEVGGDTLQIILPDRVTQRTSPAVAGRVFNDVDGDGYWDPNEHALQGVTVFADVDMDRVFDAREASDVTDNFGRFSLIDLPTGDFAVRALMPGGYKAASAGSAGAMVSIAPDRGVGGLSFGVVRKGFDLELIYSDASMPSSFKTGTRVNVPVILTNHGNTVFHGGDTRIRVWASGDESVSKDDIRLASQAFRGRLAPGQSVKLELDVVLPDSLESFYSYLIVDGVGEGLRLDLNRADNHIVSSNRLTFEGSDREPTIGLNDLNVVLANWNVAVPYGGYEPGDGFVGIDDLNAVLGNWNAGTPPTGGTIDHTPVPPWYGLWQPWLSEDNPGVPISISGTLVHDRENLLGPNRGDLWQGYEALEGWTVYLDQNRNLQRDVGEQWALTAADGSYRFEDLPTNSAAAGFPMLYVVHAEVPEGWSYTGGEFTGVEHYVQDGVSIEDANLGFYAPPQVGDVLIEGGYLANGLPTTIRATDVSDLDDTIKRVVFYYADSDNGKVDDIIGVDTDGSDGYSVVADSLTPWEVDGTHKVYAVAEDEGGHLGGTVSSTTARNAVEISAGKRLVYRDLRGAVVTTVLTGPGKARISFAGGNVQTYDLGNAIEVTGGNVFLEDLQLVQTTGRSKLKITTPGYSDSRDLVVTTGVIRGGSPLGLLYAPKMSFTFGIEMLGGGVIRNMRVGSVHGITMARRGYGNGVKISAETISGRVELGSHLRLLYAENARLDTLTAPTADRILIRNDMAGRVELTDAQADQSLGLLQVDGYMRQVTLLAASSIDTVKASEIVRSEVTAGARASSHASSSTSTLNISRGSAILNFQAGVFKDSNVAAWRIVRMDLDRVQSPLNTGNSELTYRHLLSYRGPSYLINSPGNVSGPTLVPSRVTLVPSTPDFVPFPS